MSMQCVNCERRSPSRLEPVGPGDDHRVACPAQMARHLLAPLEWRIAGPRPGGRDVWCRVVVAPRLDAAVLVDQLQLLLRGEVDAVQERHLVERARGGPFEARAVVAPDVEDQRVVEVAHLLDGVEEASGVPVGVVLEARVDLHLPGVELLRGVVERVPRLEEVRPRGELRILRDHAECLLALEDLLAELVPPLVELALVLVGPLFPDVVRRVGATRRVVHEPRLLGILSAHGVQPLDRLVRQVVGEVVLATVGRFRHADVRIVLRDQRIPLARGAAEEAPEAVEAPGLRPVRERPGSALLTVRRQVPLAEAAGHVAVLPQHARERHAGPRHGARVARERAGELLHGADSDSVVVPPRQHRRPGWRAQCRHMKPVVGEALLLDARQVGRRNRSAEGVRLAEAGVVDHDDQHVRRALRRLRPGDDRPVGDRLVERTADRAAEVPVRDREHGAVGDELAHRLRESVLKRLEALLVGLHDRLRQRARECLLDREPLRIVECGDDGRRPRRQVLADRIVHLRLDPVVDEPPEQPAGDCARGCGREQRRSGQPDQDADCAAPLDSLAAAVIGRLRHVHGAVRGVRDQDRGLHLHLLALDELGERVEVLRCGVDVRVRAHQDIRRCVSHHVLLSAGQYESSPIPAGRGRSPHSPASTSIRPESAAACSAS